MDTKPRKMTAEDYRVLNSCAEMVWRLADLHSRMSGIAATLPQAVA